MEKEFVPYEQALTLKELGFDEPCFMFYEQGTSSKYLQKGIDDDYWGDYSEPRDWNSIPNKPWKPFCQCISAPLYQQAFRWFREKGFLISFSSHNKDEHDFYFKWSEDKSILSNIYDTYEEVELACLEKLIEIVENKSE
jgi:hypothetical protein